MAKSPALGDVELLLLLWWKMLNDSDGLPVKSIRRFSFEAALSSLSSIGESLRPEATEDDDDMLLLL